jgi:hypothetical protein
MKRVEYWLWGVKNERGKVHTTRHRMTVETALARHPEAVRVEGSCEIREAMSFRTTIDLQSASNVATARCTELILQRTLASVERMKSIVKSTT